MSDYYKDDIQICIKLREDISQMLEAHFGEGAATLSTLYEASIVNNHRKPEYINLIIYHPPYEYLFEKFQYLQENGVNVLECLNTRPANKTWDYPDILDFSKSKLISIKESHHWEHNKKPLVLIIENLDKFISGNYAGHGHFQLTENVLQHIDKYIGYGQLGNHDPSDLFISYNDNREVSFGDIRFILSFNHDYGEDFKFKFEINRDAFLTITDDSEKLTDLDLIERGNLICTLMSFYWQKSIDFFHVHVRVNNKKNYHTRIKYKYSNHYIDESLESPHKHTYPTVYDFIETLNYTKILDIKTLLDEIVPRIIKAKIVDEISEFMLLYNVIEKIRNYCINNPLSGSKLEIKEEFKFINGKGSTDKYIKNKIKEIVEIVDPSENDAFLALAKNKVTFIKKTGLIDQFDSIVAYLGLNPETYSLDFTNLITIRNNIYHGKPPNEDLKPYNIQMRSLINDLVLKLIQQ